jgi:hypothetical protein
VNPALLRLSYIRSVERKGPGSSGPITSKEEVPAVSDVRIRTCTVCGEAFASPRTMVRPLEKCGEQCRRAAQRVHQQNYMRRLLDARHQLAGVLAA